MWTISALDVLHLKTPGGDRFTSFVDSLIRAQAFRNGVADSQIATNLRTNIKDGGVDAEVKASMTAHDPTGYFSVPTCWQYKAQDYADISDQKLLNELKRQYAKDLVEKGYGYRFCICDDLPANKKETWQKLLKEEVEKTNPLSPKPLVIAASDLATWTNRFWAVIPQFFRPDLDQVALHMEAWGAQNTAETPNYVRNPNWDSNRTAILDHVVFTNQPADVVLSITGQAGVGKTRLIYETLRENPQFASLVLCPASETMAEQLATAVANDESQSLIVVADDCSLDLRVKLRETLRGAAHRVRVITIDNFAHREAGPNPEFHLERMPRQLLEQILRANFPAAPMDILRAALDLAGGFVRIGADLCRSLAAPAVRGDLSAIPHSLNDYIHHRLNDQEQECLKAIALLHKVGFRDDVEHELKDLCATLGLHEETIRETAKKMKVSPGFIVQAGRYFYVTPELIARFAFEQAWDTWVEHRAKEFLSGFSPSLLQSFQERVAQSGADHIRTTVSDFFCQWAAALTPPMLQEPETVDQLESLVETHPATYLPLLRGLVESATPEALFAIKGDSLARRNGEMRGRWGPRRWLVWLVERLARFPEYFHDAEATLYHLALAESEPNIGNNATAIWRHLYRIQLSGTAVSFPKRIEVLQQRFAESKPAEHGLLFSALHEALGYVSSRWLGPAVVAGRIPPQEWHPRDAREERDCHRLAARLLVELVCTGDDDLRTRAMAIGVKLLRSILFHQLLEEAMQMFPKAKTPSVLLPDLLSEIEEFLNFDASDGRPLARLHDYVEKVRAWKVELTPVDFHGRLISIVGHEPWRPYPNNEIFEKEIESLAAELHANQEVLAIEIPWLYSAEAKSAVLLGKALGQLDSEGRHISKVFSAAITHNATAFARGYVLGLLKFHPSLEKAVNQHIDEIEQRNPQIAFDLFLVGAAQTNAIARLIRLIEAGSLPPEFVRGLLWSEYPKRMTAEEFSRLLSLLNPFMRQGNKDIAAAAITLLGNRIHDEKKEGHGSILADVSLRNQVWELVEIQSEITNGEVYWWEKLLEELSKYEPEKAIRLATRVLFGEGFYAREIAENFLVRHASSRPGEVMEALGDIMLDDSVSWHFFVQKNQSLIDSIPLPVVTNWLDHAGVEAARKIARSLPPPKLDENGNPVVPPLTEWVLDKFESDDRVYSEFLAGTINGEMMSGDIAAIMREEARVARLFSAHRLRRIREWAVATSEFCEKDAEMWQQQDEELLIR